LECQAPTARASFLAHSEKSIGGSGRGADVDVDRVGTARPLLLRFIFVPLVLVGMGYPYASAKQELWLAELPTGKFLRVVAISVNYGGRIINRALKV